MVLERQVGAVGTLDRKLADEWRRVLHNLGVPRHEEVDDDVDVGAVILGGHRANELEGPQAVPLMVAMFLKGIDKSDVLAVAQRGRVKVEVDISRADMRHVSVAQQQPGNGAADNRKLALEAAEYLTDLDEHGSDRCCRPIVVVNRGLRFSHSHGKHFDAI